MSNIPVHEQFSAAPILHTERLTLRPMRADDWPAYRDLMASDRAAFLGGPHDGDAAWGMFCIDVAMWPLYSVGALMIDLTETGETLGQVGINSGPFYPEQELGWFLYPDAEGKAFAFEAASALRDWARDVRKSPTLTSYIAPANLRSRRLAERLGAQLDLHAARPDSTTLVYRHW